MVFRNLVRFTLIVVIQVLILNKISLRWWSQPAGFPVFNPFIYPLFILLLPFEVPVWGLLVLGLLLGLTIDAFQDSAGMHACATVLIAYLRTNVLTTLLQKNMVEYPNQSPSVRNMGWVPFMVYSLFLIIIHHAVFFIIQLWTFSSPGYLLLKIVASSATSMLFVLGYLLLFTRQSVPRT
jgi:rod shape-determining protein MreD